MASLAGLVHPAGMGSYNAVKAAVVAFTETTGHELAAYGVHAHVVCPSYFRTNLMDSPAAPTRRVGAVMRRLVDGVAVRADDIAAAVLEGVERGDELIVPDDAARSAYAAEAGRPGGVRRADAQAGGQAGGARMTPTERPTVGGRDGVREEDAFDVEAVAGWLRDARRRRTSGPTSTATPEVRQFSGGASNLTYLLRYPPRDLILRRAPRGTKAKGAHDMGREYRIQQPARAGLPATSRRWSASATTPTSLGATSTSWSASTAWSRAPTCPRTR